MIKVTFISDTHGQHQSLDQYTLSGDILIYCGDLTAQGRIWEFEKVSDWIIRQNFQHKIVIAGNHDIGLHLDPNYYYIKNKVLQDRGIIYLEDALVDICGLQIYGMPWTPEFGDWAFMYPQNKPNSHIESIPRNVQILVTHGPPYGIKDLINGVGHVGCQMLLNKIEQTNPRIHAFGHIHEGYSAPEKAKGTWFLNAASTGIWSETNPPISLDLSVNDSIDISNYYQEALCDISARTAMKN